MVIVRIILDNVIKFPEKDRIFKMSFVLPESFEMCKTAEDSISLEMRMTENGKFYATAMIVAKNRSEAREKITKIVRVDEWVETT